MSNKFNKMRSRNRVFAATKFGAKKFVVARKRLSDARSNSSLQQNGVNQRRIFAGNFVFSLCSAAD